MTPDPIKQLLALVQSMTAEQWRELHEWAKDDTPKAGLAEENARLREADRLLRQIHADADAGNLDGVDLDWMVEADAYLLGKAKDTP